MMYLSKETSDGLKMTSMHVLPFLLYVFNCLQLSCIFNFQFTANSGVLSVYKVPEVKIFFSHTLCQDPLENFFGCQWPRGGTV